MKEPVLAKKAGRAIQCAVTNFVRVLSSGASLIAFQARQARDIYVLTMRNDANLFAWLYLGATMLGFPAAVLIGYVQAAETFRPLFNRRAANV